ncbi:MAG: serine/threonine-protein kinase, partial [Planctomycetaceae bacterium]
MADGEFKIDQYTVIGDIAAGQVSDVFEVMEEGTGNRTALKMLREEIVTDPGSKESKVILSQFKQEFKLGEMLEHPNLVSVYDFKMKIQVLMPIKDPIAYFTMDYFRSQNLKTAMTADLSNTQQKLERLLEQICEAVGYIHSKGWIHRDIKPDNLLLTKASEARVIDLSLAMKINKRSKIIQGTRTYIAPETIKKQKAVPQTDIYSLGITIYEVLTGQVPFTGTSPTELLKRHIATKPPPPSELNSNVTPELDRLVAK